MLIVVYRPDCNPSDFNEVINKANGTIDLKGLPTPTILVIDFNFPNMGIHNLKWFIKIDERENSSTNSF